MAGKVDLIAELIRRGFSKSQASDIADTMIREGSKKLPPKSASGVPAKRQTDLSNLGRKAEPKVTVVNDTPPLGIKSAAPINVGDKLTDEQVRLATEMGLPGFGADTAKKTAAIAGAGGAGFVTGRALGDKEEAEVDPTLIAMDETKEEIKPQEQTKPKKSVKLPVTKESKADKEDPEKLEPTPEEVVENRINGYLDYLDKLQDPPITADDLRKQAMADLKSARDNREQVLNIAKILEKMIGAITKYSAAREGLARNLDMSRAEIDKTDWDSMINRTYDRYKTDVNLLIDQYDKEDQAKQRVDRDRKDVLESVNRLRLDLAKLRDQRRRDAERAAERRRELALREQERAKRQEFDEKKLALEERKLAIRAAENEQNEKKKAHLRATANRFTDDPATARELTVAAYMGKDALRSALSRSGVADKLIPSALQEFYKPTFFGLGADKVDVGEMRDVLISEPETESREILDLGQTQNLSKEDLGALQFIMDNPDDPRVPKIRERLLKNLGK